jgi:hypothetical protein
MEVVEVSHIEFGELFSNPYHVFNSAAFNHMNSYKCDKVFYLFFKDSKVRLGIILGQRGSNLNSPFSAPFGGFIATNDDIKLSQIDGAIAALIMWANDRQIEGIRIIPPSFFYNTNFLNKLQNCLFRAGFISNNIELNYQFPTKKFNENYQSDIWYNARKNLKRSLQFNLEFNKILNEDGKQAYDVIARNREERGFPLRLTWEQLNETISIVSADFFLVKKEQESIAAAIVFHVAKGVVQVIYWGDLPEYSEYKTMNFLSFQVFQYYMQEGIAIIDIGPSTENSVPNNGLCEFKESIGCDINIKTEFYKKLN